MPSGLHQLWFKLVHWEFWPFNALYFPVHFYYLWLAIRCRSFFFFTAANPKMDFGGMMGESKSKIYDSIPHKYLPKHRLFQPSEFKDTQLFAKELGFPLIAKPDVGERGRLVEKINNEMELNEYINACPVPFILQEYVPFSLELGLFFVKIPGEITGKITSLVQKEFLKVTGDGISSVKELLQHNKRALLQIDFQHARFQELFSKIPQSGKTIVVEGVGNHCRGTIFLNAQEHITPALNQAINALCGQIEAFYFGRFDIRCKSFADLERLENFKILELNGAGAEPAHIYHPGASLLKAYRSIFWHLSTLAHISRLNRRQGTPYWTFSNGLKKLKMIRKYAQQIKPLI